MLIKLVNISTFFFVCVEMTLSDFGILTGNYNLDFVLFAYVYWTVRSLKKKNYIYKNRKELVQDAS